MSADGRGELAVSRRSVLGAALVGAAGLALAAVRGVPGAGAAAGDVPMLQTAAALENLLTAVYGQVLGLPAATGGTSIPVLRSFVVATMQRHTQHAQAFNAAAVALGGRAQTGIDAAVNGAVVVPAVRGLSGPADVLRLTTTLEDTAAATQVGFGAAATDPHAVRAFATVAPVTAQHAAVLRTVAVLLAVDLPQLVAQPPDVTKLPGTAGAAGFPAVFLPTSSARPAAEGAVGA